MKFFRCECCGSFFRGEDLAHIRLKNGECEGEEAYECRPFCPECGGSVERVYEDYEEQI